MKESDNKILKFPVNVNDSLGYYLAADAVKSWTEEFTDEDTGEAVPIKHNEIIASMGAHINQITLSLLKENSIKEVLVTTVELLGRYSPAIGLWDVSVQITFSKSTKTTSYTYIITAESPAGSEDFMINELEQTISGTFKITKIAQAKYDKIIRVNRKDEKRLNNVFFKWYRSVLMIGGVDMGYKQTLLIQASDLRKIQGIIQDVNREEGYDGDYDILEIKELSIREVFIPDKYIKFYDEN